jgi:hypothetical protein
MITPTGTGVDRTPAPSGRWLLAVSAALCFAVVGCGPSDPLEKKVAAGDNLSFTMWETKAEGDLSPEQAADMKQALQEYRFHIMAEGSVHGSDAIGEALMQMIDGKTLRQVILQGLGWGLERSEAERAQLEDSLKKNALMTTRPGDTASANYLADLHDRQVTRLAAATDEVKKTRDRIAADAAPAAK